MAARAATSTFASLLRSSDFIKRGDFRNSLCKGTIFHVVNNDLYVDVGLKFHAVVKKPQLNSSQYVRGAQVNVRLLRYEITDRFLGMDTDTTLLEADAVLVDLVSSPVGSQRKPPSEASRHHQSGPVETKRNVQQKLAQQEQESEFGTDAGKKPSSEETETNR